jgi:hypothetical protein
MVFSLKNSVFKTQEIKRLSLFIYSSGNLPSPFLISGASIPNIYNESLTGTSPNNTIILTVCYCQGNFIDFTYAGGIYGNLADENSGSCVATNCYSTEYESGNNGIF